ncbi:MAG: hypothetical protein AAGA36_00235 [Pseudomonadota bacterium]
MTAKFTVEIGGLYAADDLTHPMTKGQTLVVKSAADIARLKLDPGLILQGDQAAESAVLSFDDMTVDQLKAYADDKGIDLGEAKRKADMAAVLQAAAETGPSEAP